MKIVDVHTHAFPDKIAERAIKKLGKANVPYKPFTNGTVSGLLASMDKAGIHSSFILNIATKPKQAIPIRKWSREIASERIIPLGSVHPDSADWKQEIDGFRAIGIRGLKFQSMYQNFAIDDRRMFPIYEYAAASKMFVILHAGCDVGFPGSTLASVDKICVVLKNFPELRIIAAHLGGWKAWADVYRQLCGKNIFLDTSFIHEVDETLRNKILLGHDRQRFLFGSDSPWLDQAAQVEFIRNLSVIDDSFKEGIFCGNIARLLQTLDA